MAGKKVLPPTYLFISIALMVMLHFLFPLYEVIAYPWVLIGILPLLLGIALNLMADKAFKMFNTTVKPFQESTALITTGVFRFTRHPMYLGILLFCLAFLFVSFSLVSIGIWITFFISYDRMTAYEEQSLIEILGEQYTAYQKRVSKWLPGVW